MARLPGGVAAVARSFTVEQRAPVDRDTLQHLASRHPDESREAIAAALRAARETLRGRADVDPAWLPDHPFHPYSIRTAGMRKLPLSAPGVDGFRVSHLQSALGTQEEADKLPETWAGIWTTTFEDLDRLPQEWWTLFPMARLSASGHKRRPIAVCGTMRRVLTFAWCDEYIPLLAETFREVGRFGVTVSGGVGQVALWARLHREVGSWIIALDAANAFNSVSRVAIIANLADTLSTLQPFVGKLYGAPPPSLFFRMDDGSVETVLSRTKARQRDPLGMVLFCFFILPALRSMRARALSAGGTPGVAYADDIATAPAAITTNTVANLVVLLDNLATVGVQFARGKTFTLPPAGHRVISRKLELLAGAGISLVPADGLLVVGVPIRSDSLSQSTCSVQRMRSAWPTVARHVAAMEDAQTVALVLTMSLLRRTGYLERNVDSRLGTEAWRRADTLWAWPLEHVMRLPGTAPYDTFAQSGYDGCFLTLREPQRLETSISHRSGGLGIESGQHHAPAAFLGNLAFAFPAVFANLEGTYAAEFRTAACSTQTVTALLANLRSVVADGYATDDLGAVLPQEWITAALAGGLDPPPPAPKVEALATHCAPPAARAKEGIGKSLNAVPFTIFRGALQRLIFAPSNVVHESVPEALARYLQLVWSRGSCMLASTPIGARPGDPAHGMRLSPAVGIGH